MSDTAGRDRNRALDAIARDLCLHHFTDGFCGGDRPNCQCRKLAASSLNAMAVVGVEPVWTSAPERRADLHACDDKLDNELCAADREDPANSDPAPPARAIASTTDGGLEGGPTVARSG